MNTKELMVGDWVTITEPDDFHGYTGKVVIINGETGYITVHIPDMHLYDVFVEDLQPIPLTSEILEKNGFKKKVWYCGINNIITYEIVDNFHVEVSKNGKGFCIVDNIKDYGDHTYEANWLVDIKCVHELQHILKDFKIEKKIVL